MTSDSLGGIGRPQLMRGVLTAYIVAVPFYLFKSGIPQPAHYLLVLMLALTLFDPGGIRILRSARASLTLVFAFISYTICVNGVVAFLHGDPAPLFGSLYFVYNALLLVVLLSMAAVNRDAMLDAIASGVLLSVGLQSMLGLAGLGMGGVRRTLFFNNPNQLGYYALLCGTALILVSRRRPVPYLRRAAFLAAVCFLVAISLSKAAIIACVLLLSLDFILARSRGKAVIGLLVLANVLTLVAARSDGTLLEPGSRLMDDVWRRVQLVGSDSDDNLDARGYDRIVENPERLVLGAGHGLADRFDSSGGEIHSTFGSVLFCYGIVGFGMLAAVLFRAFANAGTAATLLCVPILLYGLTHNGVRQTLLWLIVATLFIIRDPSRRSTPDVQSYPSRSSVEPI